MYEDQIGPCDKQVTVITQIVVVLQGKVQQLHTCKKNWRNKINIKSLLMMDIYLLYKL